MKPFFGDERPNNYWWFVKGTEGWTGVVMVVLMIIAYILAQPWFRRNRLNLPSTIKKLTGFNAFWYSHHLFVIVYVLFIIHGYFLYLSKKWYKKTVSSWPSKLIDVPCFAIKLRCHNSFLSEKLIRHGCTLRCLWYYMLVNVCFVHLGQDTKQWGFWRYIQSLRLFEALRFLVWLHVNGAFIWNLNFQVAVYPGNVMAVHMSKPLGFKYTSGQYIFVNCSDVSSFQW